MRIVRLLVRIIVWGFVALLSVIVFPIGGRALFRAIWELLSGWWPFLGRTLPRMQPSADAIVSGLAYSVLALSLIHILGRWLLQARMGSEQPWKWRWTAMIFTAVWLVFFNIMAVTGVAHQMAWLSRSKEPLLEPNYSFQKMNLTVTLKRFASESEDSAWDKTKLHQIIYG